MSLYVGVQLECQQAFGTFRPAVRYYFAGSGANGRVLLVWFHRDPQYWRAHTITVPQAEFEALVTGPAPKLRPSPVQWELPEWLHEVERINFDAREAHRYPAKKSTYRRQVEHRLMLLADALKAEGEILQAVKPLRVLSRYARKAGRNAHPHRFQTWFFAYVLHGRNLWALKQATHRRGTWKRDAADKKDRKFGRPPRNPSWCFNSASPEMRAQCKKSYLARCGLGVSLVKIHRRALLEDFGCEVFTDVHGARLFTHPENRAFPSYQQFYYAVIKAVGRDAVRCTLYGPERIRSKARVERGNYTAQYSNVLDAVEVDAFYTERPRAVRSDEVSAPLAVARAVCATSGAIVGVGFSWGKENADAYRSMLFCMVTDKRYIARLYGITERYLACWTAVGLPPHFRSDRGPAGIPTLVDELACRFPVKSIVPSYSGQSKPVVESSHPREVQHEGAPRYRASDLDPVEMMKRELLRAVSDNESSDISNRLDDCAIHDFFAEGRPATPASYWDYLEARGRTSARRMSLTEAVRAFWTPIDAEVDRYGVRLRNRHYVSDAFLDSPFMQRLGAKGIDAKLRIYLLPLAVRYIWAEVDGNLLELEAQTKVRIDKRELAVPLSELQKTSDELTALRSQTQVHGCAALAEGEEHFYDLTGKDWDAGRLVNGRPPPLDQQRQEEMRVAKGSGKKSR